MVGEAMTLNSIGVGQHQAGDLERAITTLEQAHEVGAPNWNLRNEGFTSVSGMSIAIRGNWRRLWRPISRPVYRRTDRWFS